MLFQDQILQHIGHRQNVFIIAGGQSGKGVWFASDVLGILTIFLLDIAPVNFSQTEDRRKIPTMMIDASETELLLGAKCKL